MPLLSLTAYNNGYNRTSTYDVDRRLLLKLNYTDQVGVIGTDNFIQYFSNTTIRDIKKQLPQLFPLRSIDPEQVILSEIRSDGQRYMIPSSDHYKTLHELKIASRSELYFNRFSASSRSKLSQLTVRLIGSEKKVDFDWDESSTTIDTLFDLVIKAFGLNLIERERIQLCTYLGHILNRPSNSGKTLTEIGLRKDSTVYLHIIKSTSAVAYDEKIYVCVKHNFDEVDLLFASPADTIADLESQIKNKYNRMKSVIFLDTKQNTIDTDNRNRKLRELGVKPSEIIYAYVEEGFTMQQTNEWQSSSLLPLNPNTVFVRCQFSDNQAKTIQALVTDTVAELTAQISTLRESQTMAHFSLWSGSITIDDQQPDKRLADFGIQPGNRSSVKDVHRVCQDVLKENM
ncbi:unnamed protein product [Rotaria sp. Silwood1]|nr:unnamed protein product [Rotaria sp. Silwood1]